MKQWLLKILVALGYRAQLDGLRRLELLLERSDPADHPLRRYLSGLLGEERRDLEEARQVAEVERGAADWASIDERVGVFLKSSFRSLSGSLGEGSVNRESALHFVECLEEEEARFFRMLASRSPNRGIREHFVQQAQRRECRLGQARGILMEQESRSSIS